MICSTAILLFTRSASQEAASKQFFASGGKKTSRKIAKQLIRHTYQQAKATGLPVITIGEQAQYGASFGERLANAYEAIFAKGYEQVIAIGNDAPGLTSKLLVQAARAFESHGIVTGPSTDGGVYLIGISKAAFQRKAFIQLGWKKACLQCDIAAFSDDLGLSSFCLPQLTDIDTPSDFWVALRTLSIALDIANRLRLAIQHLARVLPKRAFETVFSYLFAPLSP